MSIRKKLINLLDKMQAYGVEPGFNCYSCPAVENDEIADFLIENGVIANNSEWIPVGVALPKTSGRFVVTIKNKRKAHVEIRNYDHASKSWESGRYLCPDNIIAWRMRPEPYSPDSVTR